MNLHSLHLPVKDRKEGPVKHTLVPFHELQHYTNEGSEFLDDAIRTKDQPLIYTEESVAPGSPRNLL